MGLKKGTRLTDNPRDITFKFRLTQEEKKELDECSQKLGCTNTDVIIKGIKLVKDSIKKDKN